MFTGEPSPVGDNTDLGTMKAKLKLVEFEIAERSQLPVRVLKKRNGMVLGRFETRELADEFIAKLPMSTFSNKVKRGKQGNTRDRR